MIDNLKRWFNINIRKCEYFVAVDHADGNEFGCYLVEGYKDKKGNIHIVSKNKLKNR